MTGTSYVPGTWLGIVRGRTAVLLGPDTPPALAGAVWDLLGTDPEVHEVLHAVTSSSGGSLAQMPSFGILDATGPLRVFLRGDLDLAVDLPDGSVELDGRDVTTWNERRFALPGSCRLAIPAAGPAGQPELPLGEGVVLLQSLALVLAPRQPELAPPSAPPASVVVDSAGIADVRDADTDADGSAELTIAPDHEASAETVAPEHGASAETVVGVLDDDDLPAGDGQLEAEESGAQAENDGATVDPANSGAENKRGHEPSSGSPAADPLPAEALAEVHQAEFQQAGSVPVEPAVPAEAAPPASDHTSSYDHLWERTVVRSIEDAAVRDDADAEIDGTPDAGAEAGEQAAAPVPGQPEEQELPMPAAAAGADAPAAPPVPPGTSAFAAPRPAAGVLIDSVPWKKAGGNAEGSAPQVHVPQGTTPQANVPHASAEPRPAPAPAGVLPSAAGAPSSAAGGVAPAAAVQHPHPGGAVFDADHDGQTVMKSSLASSAGQPARPVAEDPAAGPTVLARVCSQGHANPPTRAQCTACGAGLLPDAVQVARPRLGRVRVSTGELLDLDQSLVIGRQPSVSRVQGGVMPRLVQVPSPEGDISRSHVEVRLEGWHVMLCDLKATNGTVLVREGQSPRRLAQNEMAILLDGDIAELGDNISLRFEEIP
ncbi:FHA domain-containing protein [Pseudarthrobacter sp. WHRI 8279]|uniref:FHA domain-containing protein n=1 Tax=Pseudarthrobacter sp. WHRI 8279 TaxID=3162566 RepID=UPI0032EBDCE7